MCATRSSKCEATGVRSVAYDLPETTTQAELVALVKQLNEDPAIDGILVQLPLPKHLDADAIIETIHPEKDVDGFHPYNIGRLALKMPLLRRPCTPRGVMTLLESTGIELKGKHAVVIGASNIVGRPMALELLLARCTVTVLPWRDLRSGGAGETGGYRSCRHQQAKFVPADWIKPGAIVIDVGINRLDDGKIYWRCRFRCGQASGRLHYPGAGRCGADDGGDTDAEYRRRLRSPLP